jgi:hypothetical protein
MCALASGEGGSMNRAIAIGLLSIAGLLAGCASAQSGSASMTGSRLSNGTYVVPSSYSALHLSETGVKVRVLLNEATAKVAVDENIPLSDPPAVLQQAQAVVATVLRGTSAHLKELRYPNSAAHSTAVELEQGLEQLSAQNMLPVAETQAQRNQQLSLGTTCAQQAMGNGIAHLTYVLLTQLQTS